jgi:hypothetical protein
VKILARMTSEAPDAKCKEEITVELGRDGYKDITVFDINNGSKDNCSEVWLSIDKTRFSCEDLGYPKSNFDREG